MRKRERAVCCVVALGVAAALGSAGCEDERPGPADASGPEVFRLNAARTGWDGSPPPRNLKLRWSYRPEYAHFLATPTVSGGRVFAAETVLDITSSFGAVVCLDAESGEVEWRTATVEGRDLKGIQSSPVLSPDGRSVLVGEGLAFDTDMRLVCLDAATGEVRWTVAVPNNHVLGSPAVRGDLVVFGAGAIERNDHLPIPHTGYVAGVRLSDGREMWRLAVVDPESSPAIGADGTVYVGSGLPLEDQEGTGAAVYALRSESDEALKAAGRERVLWKTPTPYGAVGPVTLAGDLVLVGCGRSYWGFAVLDTEVPLAGAVVALDRKTGAVRWTAETRDTVGAAIAVAGGRAFCPVGGHPEYSMAEEPKGELVALDLSDGKPLWRWTPAGGAPVLAPPAVAGSAVYAVASDGMLAVLDAGDGRVAETVWLNAQGEAGEGFLSTSGPTVAGGRLYVGSETGGLRCYGPQ